MIGVGVQTPIYTIVRNVFMMIFFLLETDTLSETYLLQTFVLHLIRSYSTVVKIGHTGELC